MNAILSLVRRILIVIALFAITALTVWYGWSRLRNQDSNSQIPTPTPTSSVQGTQQTIEEKFNVKLPDNVEKTNLQDVSGGNGSAIVTKIYENGRFESSILADLEDPEEGKQYYAWVSKGEEGKDEYEIVYMGPLQMAKGGWMIEYKSSNDLSSYNQVIVSLGKTADNKPEKIVLRGSF